MKCLNEFTCSHVGNCLSFAVLLFEQALLWQYLPFAQQSPFHSDIYFQYSRTKKLITAKITCICCCCVFITRINITAWSIGTEWRLEINFHRLKITQRFLFRIWTCLNVNPFLAMFLLFQFSFFLKHNILPALIWFGIVENYIAMLL